MYASEIHHRPLSQTARQYLQLTKPRVVLLAVFCAIIGMFLATDAMVPWTVLVFGTAGITLLAASGFVLNCLIERHIDAQMRRTAHRGSARGQISVGAALVFATVLGCTGSMLLYLFVNPLTMWLTIATFVAYALVYTVLLKPRTPQNIVIGGASGAMPPVLGWAAVTNDVTRAGAGAVPDHLRLDAAALLGAGPLPRRRLPPLRPADAAGDARLGLHPADHAALHRHAGGSDHAAVPDRHERRLLSGQRTGAWRVIHQVRLAIVAPLQRCAGAQDVQLSPSSTWHCSSAPC